MMETEMSEKEMRYINHGNRDVPIKVTFSEVRWLKDQNQFGEFLSYEDYFFPSFGPDDPMKNVNPRQG